MVFINLCKISLISTLISLSFLLFPVKIYANSDDNTFVVDLFWQHQFEFAGFYAAIEKGYYRQAGLKVELREHKENQAVISRVISGESHFGTSGTQVIEMFHKGEPLQLLASYFKKSPLVLITHPEFTKLSLLNGQRIFGSRELFYNGIIRNMLEFNRADIEKIEAINQGDPIELFKNKQIAGMLVFASDQPFTLEELNIPYRIYAPNQYGLISDDLNVFTTEEFANNNPQIVQSFIKATNAGWQYAIENPEEIIEVILDKYNTQGKSRNALIFEAEEITNFIMPNLYKIGEIRPRVIQNTSESLILNGIIDKLRPIDQLIFGTNITSKQHLGLSESRIKFLESLTKVELELLKSTSELTVQAQQMYAPYNFVVDGFPTDYTIDLINEMSGVMGVPFRFISGNSWAKYLEMLTNGEIDLIGNIARSNDRQESFSFSQSVFESFQSVAVRQEDKLNYTQLNDLAGKTVVVVKNSYQHNVLNSYFPQIILKEVDTVLDGLKMVAGGKADAYLDGIAVNQYYISQYTLSNITPVLINDESYFPPGLGSFALRKNSPYLALINKAIDTIPRETMMELKNKWLLYSQNVHSIELTAKERKFLNETPKLRIGKSVEYAPFFYTENSINKGFTFDLIQQIARVLNIAVEFEEGRFQERTEMLRNKQIDVLTDVTNTHARRQIFRFSHPYVSTNSVIVTRAGAKIQDVSLEALKGKKVAVVKGNANTLLLESNYKNIELEFIDSSVEGLWAVVNGEVDAFIGNELLLSYYIEKQFISGVHLTPLVGPDFIGLETHSFMFHQDNEILQGLFNKAFLAIPETTIADLRAKWFKKTTINNSSALVLSKEQRVWLNEHSSIKVLFPEFDLPLGSYLDNNYQGILADFVSYVKENLYQEWQEQSLKNGELTAEDWKNIDLTIVQATDESSIDVFSYSKPIVSMPIVLLGQAKTSGYVDNLSSLTGVKVGVSRSAGFLNDLEQQNKNLLFIRYKSMRQALLDIENQALDVLLCPLAQCMYIMDRLGTTNIQIIGQTDFQEVFRFAVNRRSPELLNIVDELLVNMPPQYKNSVFRRWNSREDVLIKTDYQFVIYILLIATIAILLVMIWNRKIAKYTEKLEQAHHELAITHDELSLAHEELKSTQTQLIHSEKMAGLGTLTAGVAHEINNPTNFTNAAIFMMADEVKKIQTFLLELAGGDKAEAKVIYAIKEKFHRLTELISTASAGSERIKLIVKDLSAFTRKDDLQEQNEKVSNILDTTLSLVKTNHKQLQVSINNNFDPEIACFPSKLSQVFLNVVMNACDAMAEKSFSQGESGKLSVSLDKEGKYLNISFSDNGKGMEQKIIRKMFDPFFTTKDVGKGTGLGLAISYSIIEEHGGYWQVDSEPGVGTKVSIYIPY